MSARNDYLLHEYHAHPSPELRNRVIEAYLGVAGVVARRFSGRGVEYDDLYQVAAMALMKALDRFDQDKGVSFMSYAMPTMVGEVKNFFRDRSHLIRMPRRSGELLHSIEQARIQLTQQLNRSPTADELAEALDTPVEHVLEALEMRRILQPASLDSTLVNEDEEGPELHELLGFEEAGYQQVEVRDLLRRSMDTLPDLERRVIEARYLKSQTQRQAAEALNISQMTVSRNERRAIERLKKLMDL